MVGHIPFELKIKKVEGMRFIWDSQYYPYESPKKDLWESVTRSHVLAAMD